MARKRPEIIESVMRNHNIVIIITIMLMIVGVVALLKMPRNEYPQFTIRQGVIVGVYPGATSQEVENQLTKIVENYIFGFSEVKKAKTYSHSKEGIMYIFVELNDQVKNADQFWSKLRHGLAELKMTLPPGVMALVANSDFGDTSALLITLSSETKSYKELEMQLKKLESEIRKIPATSKIKHYGLQKEKIFINVKPEMLNEYNIKSISLLGSYQTNGMINYAGVLKDGKTNLAVHLPPNFESEKDLAEQIVYSDPNGNVVRLKSIANIERRYEDPESYIRNNGRKSILLSVEMQPGNNIVEYGEDVDKAIQSFTATCPDDIEVAKISELPKYVKDSVNEFLKEFLIAIIAVILVTMLLLPLRVAGVAGITVPISVLLTLGFLYFFGVELHTVSLASLILVLGMIVDNSIVVIDNHVEKLDHGLSAWHAAAKSAKELFVPILTATLAIIVTYVPLGFMIPGTAGEFLQTIPIVVGISLILSILVAMLLVPYLNFVFIKKGLKVNQSKKLRRSFLDRMQAVYDRWLERSFRYPVLVIISGVIIVAGGIILLRNTDQQLFPELERNQFAVEVYLPTGSSIESTEKVIDSLETVLLADQRITHVTSFVGTSSPRFQVAYAPNMPAPNYGQLLINTISDKATREIMNDYQADFADRFENAHVKFKILALQLNKAPVEIRISSDSVQDIRKTEIKVDSILKKTSHIAWARTDWDQKQPSVRVNLERDKANRMGYAKGLVATSLMVGLDGIPLTTIWENDYPVEVRLTQESGTEKSIKTIEDQYVTSPVSFQANPLRSFATLSPEWTEGTIVHRNGTPTLTIFIDNDQEGVASRIFHEIQPQIAALPLPAGTSITWGGDYEGQEEVFTPMTIALGLSILLIFFIILFQFKKQKLSLLIMSTMLLTIPGAVLGLKLMDYPFSITAFVGISSLCGMVVRNGIILIDYANQLHTKMKLTVREAALAAGKRRMRPIFLTSAAASVGVIPMIISRSPLWGPLGTTICFGLIVSMVLTLFILPLLFSLIYSDKTKKESFWSTAERTTFFSASFFSMLLLVSFHTVQAQSFTLDSCKSLATQNNYQIKTATNEVQMYDQMKKSAFTNYFPKVSAGFTATRMNDYLIKAFTPEMNLPVYDGNPANLLNPVQFAYFPSVELKLLNYFDVGYVTAMQPVFTGGRIYYGNQLAGTGVEIADGKKKLTEQAVLIKTEELFFNLTILEKKLETLDGYLQFLDTLHHDVSAALKAGLVQRNDLLKVALKQNELQVNRLKLVNGIELSQRALCQHIGIPFNASLKFEAKESVIPESDDSVQDPSEAVLNRTELGILEKAVEVEELQRKMIIGENLPQIAVGAAGFYIDMMDKQNTHALALATLSIPISGWWEGSHKMKENRLKIDNARLKLNETTELLALQIVQAGNALKESRFQVEIADKTVAQAFENLKITGDNYHAGITGVAEYLEAEAAYREALNQKYERVYQYDLEKSRYLMAINRYQ